MWHSVIKRCGGSIFNYEYLRKFDAKIENSVASHVPLMFFSDGSVKDAKVAKSSLFDKLR